MNSVTPSGGAADDTIDRLFNDCHAAWECHMSFIVIIGQVIGGSSRPFEIAWYSDMVEKRTVKEAIRHGFKVRGSDDFRIGHKRGEWLKGVSFMGKKQFNESEIADTATQLGMRNYWDDPDDGTGVGWGT